MKNKGYAKFWGANKVELGRCASGVSQHLYVFPSAWSRPRDKGGLSSRRLDKGGGLQKVFSGLGDLLFRRFLYPAQQTSKGEGKRGKRERGLAPPFFAPTTQAIDFEMLPSFSRPSKKRMRPWNEVSVFTWPVIKRNHTHTHTKRAQRGWGYEKPQSRTQQKVFYSFFEK